MTYIAARITIPGRYEMALLGGVFRLHIGVFYLMPEVAEIELAAIIPVFAKKDVDQ